MADQQGMEKPLITSSGPDSGLNGTQKPDQSGFAGPKSLKPVLPRDSLNMIRLSYNQRTIAKNYQKAIISPYEN